MTTLTNDHAFFTSGRNKYVCTECGAEDSDRTNEPPAVLICWNCKSGRKMSPADQLRSQTGMMRVVEDTGA